MCPPRAALSGQLPQRLQNLGNIRMLSQFVDLHPSDLAVLVNNEHGTIVDEGDLVFCRWKDAIIRRCGSVGPAVRREGEAETTERLLEGDMAENGVGTYAHDLGVEVSKAGEIGLDC